MKYPSYRSTQAAFTLIEMAVVIVILGLMTTIAFKTQSTSGDASTCAANNQAQLVTINQAVKAFVTKNQRYPFPAGRNIAVNNPLYGVETPMPGSLANIDRVANGGNPILFGALPFVTLGLSASFAADCWGNKFTYDVTESLTSNSDTGGYKDTATLGGITVNGGTLASPTLIAPKVAYVVLSHGENGSARGGVAKNYTGGSHGWCAVGAAIDTENCDLSNANLFLSTYNNGANAGANYFDDTLVFGMKIATVTAQSNNLYCWGYNGNGALGNNSTTSSAVPVLTTLPADITYFKAVTHPTALGVCALGSNDKIYCWGDTYSASVPTLREAGGATFKQIDGGGVTSYIALDVTGRAYWWSPQDTAASGEVAVPASPTPVTMPGGVTFAKVAVDSTKHYYALGTNGNVYGWSNHKSGGSPYGNPTVASPNDTRLTPTLISGLPGGLQFKDISAGGSGACALSTTGISYCWGDGYWGQLGQGAGGNSNGYAPVQATRQSGVLSFWKIFRGSTESFWLGSDNNGSSAGINNYGEAATNAGAAYAAPAPFTALPGGVKFVHLSIGGYSACGIGDDNKTYCWGQNDQGQRGSTGGTSYIPQLVTMPSGITIFSKVEAGGTSTCAFTPPVELPCAIQSYTWADAVNPAKICSTTTPLMPNSAIQALTDTPNSGTIKIRCNNGVIEQAGTAACGAGSTPGAACPAKSLTWGGGCAATFSSIPSGQTSPDTTNTAMYRDHYWSTGYLNPENKLYDGKAKATCTDGEWGTPTGTCWEDCGENPQCGANGGLSEYYMQTCQADHCNEYVETNTLYDCGQESRYRSGTIYTCQTQANNGPPDINKPCYAQTLSWGNGCSATFPETAWGNQGNPSVPVNNTAPGHTGTATAKCQMWTTNNGVWLTPEGSCN